MARGVSEITCSAGSNVMDGVAGLMGLRARSARDTSLSYAS